MTRSLIVYTDYKSPYAFVANAAIAALEESHGVTLDWRPYTLRIAEFLDPVASRSAHNWRKVRYAYRDARRFANQQGLILKGPVRIFDAWLASAGMLFAQGSGFFPAYHQMVFTRFWAHQLDLDVLDELVGGGGRDRGPGGRLSGLCRRAGGGRARGAAAGGGRAGRVWRAHPGAGR